MTPAELNALGVVAGVILALVLFMTLSERKLRREVFSCLNNAAENGYFEPGEYLHGATAEVITDDLRAFADTCYEYEPRHLLPYVREWLHKTGRLEP